MGDFPYIEWLAREYKGRAEISGLWTDYIKAHGLANYCVVKDSREDRCQLVYSIEDSWFSGRHPLSYVEHQQLIRQQKSRLKSYRDETCKDYKQLEVEMKILSAHEPFSEANLKQAQSVSHKIFDASKKVSQGLVKMSADIISSSVGILQRIDLTAPCKFAVIGLGSLAKGEATPYSDLEYAFIVERDDASYFEKLAVDSYFRIGNLGETPLKHFDIEELKVKEGCTPIVWGHIAAGYRIDGLTTKAGNIPTGNGKVGSQALTLTADKLIDLYKSAAESPFDGLAGDLLASTVVIYTNEEEMSLLHEEFVRTRIAYELGKDCDLQSVHKRRVELFNSDITSYTFLPEFIRFQSPKNIDIKVKTDIFRYPTLLASNINMLMGWNLRYSWDIFSNLHRQGMLSDENYRYITIVLALSMYMRTSAYISCGCQTEVVSLMPTTDDCLTSRYHVPSALFVLLGSLLVPIKQTIKAIVDDIVPGIGSVKETVKSMLQDIKVCKANFLQQAEVCYFAGRYDLVKLKLSEQLGASLDTVVCSQFLDLIQQTCKDVNSAEKWVELCCYVLYYTRNVASALSYFEWLIKNKKRGNIGLLTLLAAQCKQEMGDYQTSRDVLNEAKCCLQETGKGLYVADANHEDVYISYEGIGSVHHAMGEYETALGYFTKGLDMSEAINGELHSHTAGFHNAVGITLMYLGKHASSLEHLTKSMEIRIIIHGDTSNHPHIANTYNVIGTAYRHLGDYRSAIAYYTKSLDMTKAIYGATSNHPDIAHNYNLMGSAYGDLGKYETSLRYHMQAMHMIEAMPGDTNKQLTLGHIYTEVGTAFGELEKHTSSLEYHKTSLKVLQAVYGTANVPQIAHAHSGIGGAYLQLGDLELSLEYHTKALDIRKVIYGAAANHSCIAENYSDIAYVYNNLNNYDLALDYLTKALEMHQICSSNHSQLSAVYYNMGVAYGHLGKHRESLQYHLQALQACQTCYEAVTNHRDIADSYDNIGEVYSKLGERELSLEYHIKAFDMRKAIHGDNSNHPCMGESYNNIGLAYYDLGNYILSLEYHHKALDVRKAIYGTTSNHPDIIASTKNIGRTYRCLDGFAQ